MARMEVKVRTDNEEFDHGYIDYYCYWWKRKGNDWVWICKIAFDDRINALRKQEQELKESILAIDVDPPYMYREG